MKSIVLGQDKFEFLGGTTTLLIDMAAALLRQGYTVYYWSTDFGRNSITEQWFKNNNIQMYVGQPVDMAITCQQTATMFFLNKCKVLQILNSKFTSLEYPVEGCTAYISISEEIRDFVKEKFNLITPILLNGIDLERYKPSNKLADKPRVLSICQGDDTLLETACKELGYEFKSVPKEVGNRVWNIDELLQDIDIVVGIGRSALVGMAAGKCVISWDNRSLNPYTGCGYIEPENFFKYAVTNFTGRGFKSLSTVDELKKELLKYNPEDGVYLNSIAKQHLNADINSKLCVDLLSK